MFQTLRASGYGATLAAFAFLAIEIRQITDNLAAGKGLFAIDRLDDGWDWLAPDMTRGLLNILGGI